MPTALSSNGYSFHDQIADALSWLSHAFPEMSDKFVDEYPEYNRLEWTGAWVDHEASNVDPDYMSWVADWLENNTPIYWSEGEPRVDNSDNPFFTG